MKCRLLRGAVLLDAVIRAFCCFHLQQQLEAAAVALAVRHARVSLSWPKFGRYDTAQSRDSSGRSAD